MVKKQAGKARFAKGLLAGASGLASLLIAEVAVRVLDLPPRPLAPLPIPGYQLSANPVIGFEYRPSYRPADEPADPSQEGFATNSAGFRDVDHSAAKPAGTRRIVVLGDSTTAGCDVADRSALYTTRLEELLNRNRGDPNTRYEVLNFGVGGYHTLQEVETLRIKGLRYQPDLVLLTVCVNDFDLHSDGGVVERLRQVNHISVRGEGTGRTYRALLRHSRLAFILHHRLRSSPTEYRQWYAAHVLRGQSTVRAGLALLAELQQEHGFASLVAILPEFSLAFHEYPAHDTHRRVFEAAAGLPGIRVVDLLESFAAVDDDASRFSNDCIHLNERGHEVMAQTLLPLVRQALAPAGETPGSNLPF
ncbi:MAG: SGNH/GDSL hydrolase family protein [Lentisphaeria bacterium]|nr:SGNH/GDSL hydrolase family protein [Lentisphaeria bacterium]